MAEVHTLKDASRERSSFTARVIVLFLIALAGTFALGARLVQLQVLDYERYATRSDENRIQLQPLAPPRGLIFDRHGVLLADNRPVFTLWIVHERVHDLDALLKELRSLVALSDDAIDAV